MSPESEPLSHPLRETYSIFLLLTTWASPSQSKHRCLWMGWRLPDLKPCRPSRHLGSGENFPWVNVYVMWKAENPREHAEIRPKHTHRGQLPSIKPETPASAVPYAQNQPALICASQGKRYRAWKITGKKNNYCIKGSAIKVNRGTFRLRGRREAGINDGCHSCSFSTYFPFAFSVGFN